MPDGEEVVLARVVPADGRSPRLRRRPPGHRRRRSPRQGRRLVDLHGQHAHQSLLVADGAARGARPLRRRRPRAARRTAPAAPRCDASTPSWPALGGDDRRPAREIDLLRFQVDEIDGAGLDDPDEDDAARRRGGAARRRRRPTATRLGGAPTTPLGGRRRADAVGAARGRARRAGRRSRELEERLRAVARPSWPTLGRELRAPGEADRGGPGAAGGSCGPGASSCASCARKYGDRWPSDRRARGRRPRPRLRRAGGYEADALADARRRRARARPRVAAAAERGRGSGRAARDGARRPAWPTRCSATSASWPCPSGARGRRRAASRPAATTSRFLLAANPGEPARPLAKVGVRRRAGPCDAGPARWCSREAPPTLVFDEVDAGIGGEAALAVGPVAGRPRRRTTRCSSSPTSRRWRRSPTPRCVVEKREQGGAHAWPAPRASTATSASSSCRACCRGSREQPHARGHADELLDARAERERARR